MADRPALKAEIEKTARERGHTLGPWLDLPHASQVGCLACDRWGFVEVLPAPGKLHLEALGAPCPDPQDDRPATARPQDR